MSKIKNKERLDKILTNSGFGPRTVVKNLINKKLVTVNGEIAKSSSNRINLDSEILVCGEKIKIEHDAYFMMNKVAGCVCSKKNEGKKTVFDFLTMRDNRKYLGGELNTIGRLDADTEGLLIITSDGDLIHRITSPKNNIEKSYLVFLKFPVDEKNRALYEEKCKNGIHIAPQGREKAADCKPCKIEWQNRKEFPQDDGMFPAQVCTITVTEGKFHEIKRIFCALGNEVLYLRRIKIGMLYLDHYLKTGDYRRMTQDEVSLLLQNE